MSFFLNNDNDDDDNNNNNNKEHFYSDILQEFIGVPLQLALNNVLLYKPEDPIEYIAMYLRAYHQHNNCSSINSDPVLLYPVIPFSHNLQCADRFYALKKKLQEPFNIEFDICFDEVLMDLSQKTKMEKSVCNLYAFYYMRKKIRLQFSFIIRQYIQQIVEKTLISFCCINHK